MSRFPLTIAISLLMGQSVRGSECPSYSPERDSMVAVFGENVTLRCELPDCESGEGLWYQQGRLPGHRLTTGCNHRSRYCVARNGTHLRLEIKGMTEDDIRGFSCQCTKEGKTRAFKCINLRGQCQMSGSVGGRVAVYNGSYPRKDGDTHFLDVREGDSLLIACQKGAVLFSDCPWGPDGLPNTVTMAHHKCNHTCTLPLGDEKEPCIVEVRTIVAPSTTVKPTTAFVPSTSLDPKVTTPKSVTSTEVHTTTETTTTIATSTTTAEPPPHHPGLIQEDIFMEPTLPTPPPFKKPERIMMTSPTASPRPSPSVTSTEVPTTTTVMTSPTTTKPPPPPPGPTQDVFSTKSTVVTPPPVTKPARIIMTSPTASSRPLPSVSSIFIQFLLITCTSAVCVFLLVGTIIWRFCLVHVKDVDGKKPDVYRPESFYKSPDVPNRFGRDYAALFAEGLNGTGTTSSASTSTETWRKPASPGDSNRYEVLTMMREEPMVDAGPPPPNPSWSTNDWRRPTFSVMRKYESNLRGRDLEPIPPSWSTDDYRMPRSPGVDCDRHNHLLEEREVVKPLLSESMSTTTSV